MITLMLVIIKLISDQCRSSDQRSNVDIVRQRSVEVAQLFRQRRHISQDDSTSHESESSEAVHTRDRTSHCAVGVNLVILVLCSYHADTTISDLVISPRLRLERFYLIFVAVL